MAQDNSMSHDCILSILPDELLDYLLCIMVRSDLPARNAVFRLMATSHTFRTRVAQRHSVWALFLSAGAVRSTKVNGSWICRVEITRAKNCLFDNYYVNISMDTEYHYKWITGGVGLSIGSIPLVTKTDKAHISAEQFVRNMIDFDKLPTYNASTATNYNAYYLLRYYGRLVCNTAATQYFPYQNYIDAYMHVDAYLSHELSCESASEYRSIQKRLVAEWRKSAHDSVCACIFCNLEFAARRMKKMLRHISLAVGEIIARLTSRQETPLLQRLEDIGMKWHVFEPDELRGRNDFIKQVGRIDTCIDLITEAGLAIANYPESMIADLETAKSLNKALQRMIPGQQYWNKYRPSS